MLIKKTWKIIIATFFITFQRVLALTTPGERFKNLANESGYNTSTTDTKLTVVLGVVTYVLGFVGVFFLIMIIYAGFQWIMAGGNEETVEKAQTRLKNSIIGFFIIAVAYGLVIFVMNFWKVGLDNRYL